MPEVFGLIGKKLSHSFSKEYFSKKFKEEGWTGYSYELFEIPSVKHFPSLLKENPNLAGLNVTIPYKTEIMSFLTALDEAAQEIGAVNTIKISENKLQGFNTDSYGFERSLFENEDKQKIKKVLILGTGGASKAVQYVMKKNNIEFALVSRKPLSAGITYQNIRDMPELLRDFNLIINTTPLGMFPDIDAKPELPYHCIGENHIFFDLVYNPERTSFLKEGANRGAKIINGLDMLHYQAEKAWEIWNNPKI